MNPAARGDTIFALSSGAPPAAIAIVRVSGSEAGPTLGAIAGRPPRPRVATLRRLLDADGVPLDEALVLWFPGPHTATGEDLAELHLHGGRAVIAAVLAALSLRPGCRPAAPGEFTRRAFLNGRLDLAEAEGLADLLAAETEVARRQALRVAEGGLSRRIERWRMRLLDLSARIEALLEFGDDEPDVLPDPSFDEDVATLHAELVETSRAPPAERLRDGFRIVVAGPPNVGKSSLVNAIAGREAAIVADEAGTTRDLIEVPLVLSGFPILLIDGAGLREAEQAVERIGVERAHAAIAAADLLLWLGEPRDCPRPDASLIVHSRADLPMRSTVPPRSDVSISVVTGDGLAALRDLLVRRLDRMMPQGGDMAINRRQRQLIHACAADLAATGETLLPEIKAEHLRRALHELDVLVGRADVEHMLDRLFGRFCIGK